MDESLPSFEDLMREILEVPSPEVRLAGLAATREVVEQQLEIARHVELTKLQQRHVKDQTHSDDASLDKYELETQIMHLLPQVLRGGFLLALWSTLEACTKDLVAYAGQQTGHSLPNGFFRRGNFLELSERAFLSVLNINAFETVAERDSLSRLARIRAALVHHNANIEELPEDLKEGNFSALEKEGLYLKQDLHHRYFVPTEDYVKRSLALVDYHLRGLASRVLTALRSEPNDES